MDDSAQPARMNAADPGPSLERLVLSIASRFAGAQPIDEAIDHALAALGRGGAADRAALFQLDDGEHVTASHEWCREGVAVLSSRNRHISTAPFSWWMGRLHDGRSVHVARAGALPRKAAAERAFLESQGIESLLLLPVRADERLVGLLGFASQRPASHTWTDGDLAPLGVAAELIAAALLRQQAERERARLDAELLKAQRIEVVAQLAEGVAHDFNNMLSIMLTYTALVRMRTQEPGLIADLDEITDAGQRASRLVASLLSFAQSQQMASPVTPTRINDAIRPLEPLLGHSGCSQIELELRLADALPPVSIVPALIEQALTNLVFNSREAMPGGSAVVVETALVEVAAGDEGSRYGVEPGKWVRLTVRDTGHGMRREVAARAFEPFFSTKPEGEGHGLGLSTVYGIVNAARGHVHLDTEPGGGTAVTLLFPAVGPGGHLRASPSASGTSPPATILLVEGERTLRTVMRRVLTGAGYAVIEAAGAGAALRISAQTRERIDLVLTDVAMPEMNGGELAERLQAARPDLDVVLLSGHPAESLEPYGPRLDERLLPKPFTRESLLERVRSVLADRARAAG